MFDPISYKRTQELEQEKANREQEDWISLTLLDGAVGNLEIMKDQFGFVHFRGAIESYRLGKKFATIPAGYQPSEDFYAILGQGPTDRACTILVRSSPSELRTNNSMSFTDYPIHFESLTYKAVES